MRHYTRYIVAAVLLLSATAVAGPTTRPVASTQPTSRPDFTSVEAVLKAIPKDAYVAPTDADSTAKHKAALTFAVGKTLDTTITPERVWPQQSLALASGTKDGILVEVYADYTTISAPQEIAQGRKFRVVGTITKTSPVFGNNSAGRGRQSRILLGFTIRVSASRIVATR